MPNAKESRVAIYIDGSNFYNYLSELKKSGEISFKGGKHFSYSGFIQFLLGDRSLISKRYYIGIIRNTDNTSKSQKLVQGQQKFLSGLENNGFVIKRGRIMYDGGKPREKGTDVKIATDMIVGAVDDLYDTAILVSSDTDLIPAIQYIRHKKKKVEYVGFSHAPSYGIQKNADHSRLLSPVDLNNLIK